MLLLFSRGFDDVKVDPLRRSTSIMDVQRVNPFTSRLRYTGIKSVSKSLERSGSMSLGLVRYLGTNAPTKRLV